MKKIKTFGLTNLRVEAAWVIADVDDDVVIPDAPANDRITSTAVNGFKTRSAGDYATISKAVSNATTLPVSADQAGEATANVEIEVDPSVTAHVSGKFVDADMAKEATDADLTNRTTTIASGAMKNGNVIVVKTWDGTTAMYSAYIVEIQ